VLVGLLQVSRQLDVSAAPVYSLCVTASDGSHSSTVNFNVTIYQPNVDNLVEFSLPFYVFDVLEDAAAGVTVGRVEAFVDVVGQSTSSSPPSYSITSRWASSMFHLNATYGILTLAGTLDYETVSHCYTMHSYFTVALVVPISIRLSLRVTCRNCTISRQWNKCVKQLSLV